MGDDHDSARDSRQGDGGDENLVADKQVQSAASDVFVDAFEFCPIGVDDRHFFGFVPGDWYQDDGEEVDGEEIVDHRFFKSTRTQALLSPEATFS